MKGFDTMSKEEYVTGLFIQSGQFPRPIKIQNKLEAYQQAVAGNGYIECIDLPNGITLVCDEEGKLKSGMQLNRILYSEDNEIIDVISGDFLAVGIDYFSGEFVSLSKEQIKEVKDRFFCPDMFFMFNDKVHMVSMDWLYCNSGDTDIAFTDRNTGEVKYTITCSDEYERIRLSLFINEIRNDIIHNLSRDTGEIFITSNRTDCSVDDIDDR